MASSKDELMADMLAIAMAVKMEDWKDKSTAVKTA